MTEQEWAGLTSESRDIWDTNAAAWDKRMGDEGNNYHLELVRPAVTALLALQPGQTILEIGCGNGIFARYLARLGATVLATDFSPAMVELARSRTAEWADRIDYRVVDATDRDQLRQLGQGRFAAAVANMVLMDMAEIQPLLDTLPALLTEGGCFIFALSHPCFQAPEMARLVEQTEEAGAIVTRHAVKISKYITPAVYMGLAIREQPKPQHYFHRPLSSLFGQCFRAGWVIDGLEEPVFQVDPTGRDSLSWAYFQEVPSTLVVRLRRP